MIPETRIFYLGVILTPLVTAPVTMADAGHGEGRGAVKKIHGMAATDIGEPGDPVEMVTGDSYFWPEAVEVPAGATARFVVRNEGGLLREFNSGTAGMQLQTAKMLEHGMPRGTEGGSPDMDSMDQGVMGGKATADVTTLLEGHADCFPVDSGHNEQRVPTFGRNGERNFICSLAGRDDRGMTGRFWIEG